MSNAHVLRVCDVCHVPKRTIPVGSDSCEDCQWKEDNPLPAPEPPPEKPKSRRGHHKGWKQSDPDAKPKAARKPPVQVHQVRHERDLDVVPDSTGETIESCFVAALRLIGFGETMQDGGVRCVVLGPDGMRMAAREALERAKTLGPVEAPRPPAPPPVDPIVERENRALHELVTGLRHDLAAVEEAFERLSGSRMSEAQRVEFLKTIRKARMRRIIRRAI